MQVELCGHATLAAAHTLFKSGLINSNIIEFATLSGILTAKKVVDVKTDNSSNIQNGEAQESYFVELNFPADPSTEFNSGEVSLISTALDGASMIDIRRTTITDDLLVNPATLFMLVGQYKLLILSFGWINGKVLFYFMAYIWSLACNLK